MGGNRILTVPLEYGMGNKHVHHNNRKVIVVALQFSHLLSTRCAIKALYFWLCNQYCSIRILYAILGFSIRMPA